MCNKKNAIFANCRMRKRTGRAGKKAREREYRLITCNIIVE